MKYKYLDFIRAVAALLVFIGHIVCDLPYFTKHKYLALQAFGSWGPQAVIAFFMLSGIVINITAKKFIGTGIEFFKRRIIRIVPIYIVCLLFSLFSDLIVFKNFADEGKYLGSFLFLSTLQSAIVGVPNKISTVWSLSFEMFFYLFFSLSFYLSKKKLFSIWIPLVFIAIAFLYFLSLDGIVLHFALMFALSAAWLVGYFIYEYRELFQVKLISSLFSLGIIPMLSRLNISSNFHDPIIFLITSFLFAPFFIFILKYGDSGNEQRIIIPTIKLGYLNLIYFPILIIAFFVSKSLFISKLLYAILPFFAFAIPISWIRLFWWNIIHKTEKWWMFLSGISYAIYLIHLPLIFLIGNFFPDSILIPTILVTICTGLLAWILEMKFQPFIKSLL